MATGSWERAVVKRLPGARGWSQRLALGYERTGETSDTVIQVAMMRLLVVRLGRQP